jgi:hypothetical protein
LPNVWSPASTRSRKTRLQIRRQTRDGNRSVAPFKFSSQPETTGHVMKKTPSPLRAALSAAVLAPVVAVSFAAMHSTPADAQAIIVAPAAPPAPRVEPPPPPRAGYAWDPGHWRWAHGGYVWAPGHWRPVRTGYRWIPGHWVQHGPNWRWVEGHWA